LLNKNTDTLGVIMKEPLYLQFSKKMRNKILNQEFKYGQIFPSERELESEYRIDRKTIRKALRLLVDEKLLIRVKGKGTFVNYPSIHYSMKKVMGFSRLLEQEGVMATTRVILSERTMAGYLLAWIFGINEDDYVNKLIRVRYSQDEPIALEYTYVKDVIPDFQDIDFTIYSLYDVMEKNEQHHSEIEEKVSYVTLMSNEAQLLNKEEGEPAFLVIDVTRNQQGEVVEYSKTYTNSKRIMLSTELT